MFEELSRSINLALAKPVPPVDAVIAAIEEDRPCREIVTQLSAVSSALDRAGYTIVSTAMRDCITDPDAARDERGLTTEELEKLFLMLA